MLEALSLIIIGASVVISSLFVSKGGLSIFPKAQLGEAFVLGRVVNQNSSFQNCPGKKFFYGDTCGQTNCMGSPNYSVFWKQGGEAAFAGNDCRDSLPRYTFEGIKNPQGDTDGEEVEITVSVNDPSVKLSAWTLKLTNSGGEEMKAKEQFGYFSSLSATQTLKIKVFQEGDFKWNHLWFYTGLPQVPNFSCSSLSIGKETVNAGETVQISGTVSNFGIVRSGRCPDDNSSCRVAGSINPQSLFNLEPSGMTQISFDQPGKYVFEINAYESSFCRFLCSTGRVLYQNSAVGCIENSDFFSLELPCQSSGCVQYLTVNPAVPTQPPTVTPIGLPPTQTPVSTVIPTSTPAQTRQPSLTPIRAVSPTPTPTRRLTPVLSATPTSSLTPTATPVQSVDLPEPTSEPTIPPNASAPLLNDCLYIPSRLYGAAKEDWQNYECENGQLRVKKRLSSVAAGIEDLQVENIQAPSVQNFTSSVQTGDALVSYPLVLAPAAGGFVPSLSLNYSSGAVEEMRVGIEEHNFNLSDGENDGFKEIPVSQASYTGMGWNLTGIPQIIKNSAGKYYLSLAGQGYELAVKEEKDNKTYYKTVPESYLRIVRSGEKEDSYNWDIRSWEVWTKNNTYYKFEKLSYIIEREHNCDPVNGGCCDASDDNCWREKGCNFDQYGNPTGIKFKNRRQYNWWGVTEVKDSSNNKIVYRYDTAETKTVNGDCDGCGDCGGFGGQNPVYVKAIYPAEIKYGKELRNKVEFAYSDRNDNFVQHHGHPQIVNFFGDKKLQTVNVYFGSTKVRVYQLDYDYSAASCQKDSLTAGCRLLLKEIKLLGTDGAPFPVNQSFEYYKVGEEYFDKFAFLLKKANNGYGAGVEYIYDRNWDRIKINPNIEAADFKYRGFDAKSPGRNRLAEKITFSSFNPSQNQKTRYEYLTGPHAVMLNEFWADFEFLGYEKVRETLLADNQQQLVTTYLFNQGQGNENRWEPVLTKGTLAKKVTVDKSSRPLTAEQNTYTADNNFVYLKEGKACSDLEISDGSLRRGTYSAGEMNDFDRFGNKQKSSQYEVKSCGLAGNDIGSWTVSIDSSLYRTANVSYKYVDEENKYLVDRPFSTEIKKGSKSLSLNFVNYNERGLPTEILQIDAESINAGSNIKGIWTNSGYDSFGNQVSQTASPDYALVNLSKNSDGWTYRLERQPQRLRTTTTDYDSTHKALVEKVANPLGHTAATVYDNYGRPEKVTDVNGNVTQTAYDAFGRVTKIAQPGDTLSNPTAIYSYFDYSSGANPQKVPFSVKTALKESTATGAGTDNLVNYSFYDDLGRKLQTQTVGGGAGKIFSDKVVYDSLGRVVQVVAGQEISAPLGVYKPDLPTDLISITTYDDQSRPVRVKAPDGTCNLAKYEGKKTTSFDAEGGKVLSETDNLGRLLQTQTFINPRAYLAAVPASASRESKSSKVSTQSEPSSQGPTESGTIVAEQNDFEGQVTESEGEKTIVEKITEFFKKIITYVSGRLGAQRTDFTAGSPVSCDGAVDYPVSGDVYTTAETIYDDFDRPTKAILHQGNKSGRELTQSETAYDGFGRVKQSIDPDLGTTRFTAYDALGNLLSSIDNSGISKTFEYDELARLKKTFEGTKLLGEFIYDQMNEAPYLKSLGNLVKEVTPGLLEKTFRYDQRNRNYLTVYRLLSDQALFTGRDAVEYVSFFDNLGRPVTETFGKLDANSPWLADLLDMTNYTYDSAGRIKTVVSGHEEGGAINNKEYRVSNDKYNRLGQLTEINFSSTKEVFGYDLLTGRINNHKAYDKGGAAVLDLQYQEYDNTGNLRKLTNGLTNETFEYIYDSFYRLRQVTGAINASYVYDETGRMTIKNEGGSNLSFGYNNSYPFHAPKNVGGVSLAYDRGNLMKLGNGNKLFYDNQNRITGVKDNNNNLIASYTYDYSGQRIKSVENISPLKTKTTYYHLPSIEIEVTKNGADIESTVLRRTLPGGGVQVLTYGPNQDPTQKTVRPVSDQIYQVYSDHLSSARVLTDKSGRKVEGSNLDYYPYGGQRTGSASSQPVTRLYTGQINDFSTGLYYYNARYFDPNFGIFTSADRAQGPNRYAYVGGNPIMRNDPSGNDPNDVMVNEETAFVDFNEIMGVRGDQTLEDIGRFLDYLQSEFNMNAAEAIYHLLASKVYYNENRGISVKEVSAIYATGNLFGPYGGWNTNGSGEFIKEHPARVIIKNTPHLVRDKLGDTIDFYHTLVGAAQAYNVAVRDEGTNFEKNYLGLVLSYGTDVVDIYESGLFAMVGSFANVRNEYLALIGRRQSKTQINVSDLFLGSYNEADVRGNFLGNLWVKELLLGAGLSSASFSRSLEKYNFWAKTPFIDPLAIIRQPQFCYF